LNGEINDMPPAAWSRRNSGSTVPTNLSKGKLPFLMLHQLSDSYVFWVLTKIYVPLEFSRLCFWCSSAFPIL